MGKGRINVEAFIARYQGKYLDWDGAFGAQCVDLIRFYFDEVCGLEKQPAGITGARDFYINFNRDPVLTSNFLRIPNTPDFLPKKGDIAVWDRTERNPYGHTAIFVRGDLSGFDSFDQNLPASAPCSIVHHSYHNVLGFLRYKQGNT